MNKLLSTYRFAFDQTFERLLQRDPNRFRFHVFFTLLVCLVSWLIAFATFYAYFGFMGYEWEYMDMLELQKFEMLFRMLGGAVVVPLILLVGFHRARSKMPDGATVTQVFLKIPYAYWIAYAAFTVICAWLNVSSIPTADLESLYGVSIPYDPSLFPQGLVQDIQIIPFYGFVWEVLSYFPYVLVGLFLLVTRKVTFKQSIKRGGVKMMAFLVLALVLHGAFSIFYNLTESIVASFFLHMFTDVAVPIFLLNITVFFLLALWMQYSGYLHWLIFEDAEEHRQMLNTPDENDLLDQ